MPLTSLVSPSIIVGAIWSLSLAFAKYLPPLIWQSFLCHCSPPLSIASLWRCDDHPSLIGFYQGRILYTNVQTALFSCVCTFDNHRENILSIYASNCFRFISLLVPIHNTKGQLSPLLISLILSLPMPE